ncbi:MAG: hypothetical protein GF409_00435 [Candidatus Omnitrophica bacterium]|nr:hypothetical protein [Candidatus Omnitrophota bacterium]
MVKLRVPEDLLDYINKEAESSGYQVVDLTTRGGKAFFLEIILDKEGGITLDECTHFNRTVSTWIDDQKMFELGYTLDVCSPGLDRSLKKDNDFLWALGKQVRVRTYEPVEEKRQLTGKLIKADGDKDITIEDEQGRQVRIARKNVAKAKLCLSL